MPQLQAAKKALRVSARRRVINDRWRRKVREALHDVRDAIRAQDKKAATEAYVKATSTIDRAARRNIIHPNSAARKKSRLHKAVVSISK